MDKKEQSLFLSDSGVYEEKDRELDSYTNNS